MALNLFSGGYLPLDQRVHAETLYWAICRKLQRLVQQMDDVPEELQNLDESLSDTYFCNFSLFQSMPDSWAIKQLFPIMPIHRLNERPTQHAVLGDITCDSDGKIDQFIDRRDVQEDAAAAHVQRRPVLPRRVPRRRLPGDPRRPAQPVRRHQRRARQPRRGRQGGARRGRSRATRCARCWTTWSSTPQTLMNRLRDDVERAVRDGRIGSRAVRPAAAVLRERAAGVYVPGGCASGVTFGLRAPGSGLRALSGFGAGA